MVGPSLTGGVMSSAAQPLVHGHFFYKDPLFPTHYICACGETRDRFGHVVKSIASG